MKVIEYFVPKIVVVIGLILLLNQCGFVCTLGVCLVDDFEVSERHYDEKNLEFKINGEVDGDDVSLSYKLSREGLMENLSFGMSDAEVFVKYGALKTIDTLNPKALQTYRNDYLLPGKSCPAWFMNKNLITVALIAANDYIASKLEDFEIPFDSQGTKFQLSGHYMDHLEDRYIRNGDHINLKIVEHISISSNVGSAKRKVNYFLVTGIEY